MKSTNCTTKEEKWRCQSYSDTLTVLPKNKILLKVGRRLETLFGNTVSASESVGVTFSIIMCSPFCNIRQYSKWCNKVHINTYLQFDGLFNITDSRRANINKTDA